MKPRLRVALGLLLALALAGSASAATQTDGVTLRKDWAFARCLAKTFQGQPAGGDASNSAAALLERASGGMDVYKRLEALATSYAARPYAGSSGPGYGTLKCLDLYHSRELDQVAGGRKAPRVAAGARNRGR